MARWTQARWNPVPTCGPGSINPIAVTLHHQVGNGDPASVYISRNVSAHFWIPKSGSPVQHVDTNVRAWHGGTDALNTNCIGVETEGCATSPYAEPLTSSQLDWFGALMDWANTTHHIPLVLSDTATTPGLNYHRCKGGYATSCPCDVRLNARSEILRRAGAGTITPPPSPTPPKPSTHPPYPGTLLINYTSGHGTRTWQQQMAHRGWTITVDDMYGDQSEHVCRQFQSEKHLSVDGIVGPDTWNAAWTAPIT